MCGKKSKLKSQKSKLRLVLANHSNNNDYSSNEVRNYLWQNQIGQTLIELIVVISVSVIVIGALVFATIASLRNSQFSKYQAQATKLAQEGIEKVRSARDRNGNITGYNDGSGAPLVDSWNGKDLNKPIWNYTFSGNCPCYFNIADDLPNNNVNLIYIGQVTSQAELIPPFKRYVSISDDSGTSGTQKTLTVIVKWSDFSGDHQSELTTVLGKL